MKPVTAWYVYNKKKNCWDFNHLDRAGHVENNEPIPKFSAQKAWKGLKWKKKFCYLTKDFKVIHDD